jgi:hypothetical protein
MATTPTDRLGLTKIDIGDSSGSWGNTLNGGFQDADDNLLQISSDHSNEPDPNTHVAGKFVGQVYVDETPIDLPARIWICTVADPVPANSEWTLLSTTGSESPVGWDAKVNLEVLLQDLQTRLLVQEAGVAVPRGMIDGLTLSYVNGSTFGIAAGEASSTGQDIVLTEATLPWTKTTAAYAAGDGLGARAGALSDGWWHVFAVWDTGGTGFDIAIDKDVDAGGLVPTLGFEYYRRIGALKIESSNIREFFQYRDTFWWADYVVNYNSTATTATNVVLDTPLDVVTEAIFAASVSDILASSGKFEIGFWPVDVGSGSLNQVSLVAYLDTGPDIRYENAGHFRIYTDLLSQVRFRPTAGSDGNLVMGTLGWVDPRGRNL